MKKLSLLLLYTGIACLAAAQIKPANIFGDDMVLQRNKPIPVWGWATPGEKLTVKFNRQSKTTIAAKDGKWLVTLNPEKAGGPYALSFISKNKTELKNIYVGDVWICSGQSNMEWTVANAQNGAAEVANANYPLIRHIKILNETSSKPKNDISKTNWKVCTQLNAGDFTAVGYFFARKIFNETNIPVGIINTSWGGSMVETWTGLDAFLQSPDFNYLFNNTKELDLEKLIANRKKKMVEKIENLQGKFEPAANTQAWKGAELDDSKWPAVMQPAPWEETGLPGLDGVVWLRKKIMIPDSLAGKPALLLLSKIDDNDITYVNGTEVGFTNSWNTQRKYRIGPGILKAGENCIAVRVEDTGGGGGIYGSSDDMKLVIEKETFSLDGSWKLKVESMLNADHVNPNDLPALLYNGMVHPLIPFAFTGVLWYQGETNAARSFQYRKAFPLMINYWRKKWNAGNFPFYFVQLSSFDPSHSDGLKGSNWAELREAQSMTLKLPNTGMAVSTDIGNVDDIHPRNKQDVGLRLAAIALHKVYGKKNVYSGPSFKTMQLNGNKIAVQFNPNGKSLVTKNNLPLKGFMIAGADKIFYPAEAVIEGNKVVVSAAPVTNPVALRYAWKDDAGDANLYNSEGFPAVPFRTDNWEPVTANFKFEF
ncbi:MAG: sialate O-acetylesterase [Ferruginibacter sp.]